MEVTVVYGTEKPMTTKRTRVVMALLLWSVGIPLAVGLWFWFGWLVLILVAAAAWATWDYIQRGDMFSVVDHAVSHHIRTGEDGRSRLGTDD